MSASSLKCPICQTYETYVNYIGAKHKYGCINGHQFDDENKNKEKENE